MNFGEDSSLNASGQNAMLRANPGWYPPLPPISCKVFKKLDLAADSTLFEVRPVDANPFIFSPTSATHISLRYILPEQHILKRYGLSYGNRFVKKGFYAKTGLGQEETSPVLPAPSTR
jgi:hypothetical protein